MRSYRIKYKCTRCYDDRTYTWRVRAASKREASQKFYNTEVKAWKILRIDEV